MRSRRGGLRRGRGKKDDESTSADLASQCRGASVAPLSCFDRRRWNYSPGRIGWRRCGGEGDLMSLRVAEFRRIRCRATSADFSRRVTGTAVSSGSSYLLSSTAGLPLGPVSEHFRLQCSVTASYDATGRSSAVESRRAAWQSICAHYEFSRRPGRQWTRHRAAAVRGALWGPIFRPGVTRRLAQFNVVTSRRRRPFTPDCHNGLGAIHSCDTTDAYMRII